MRETPGKMHTHDMVNIDTMVFEIISCFIYPASDRVKPKHRILCIFTKIQFSSA